MNTQRPREDDDELPPCIGARIRDSVFDHFYTAPRHFDWAQMSEVEKTAAMIHDGFSNAEIVAHLGIGSDRIDVIRAELQRRDDIATWGTSPPPATFKKPHPF